MKEDMGEAEEILRALGHNGLNTRYALCVQSLDVFERLTPLLYLQKESAKNPDCLL